MLWTTAAGMVDFIILAVVTAFAIWRGEWHIKVMAFIAVCAFHMDRATMWAFDGQAFVVANMIGTLIAATATLKFRQHVSARGYAALYVGKFAVLSLLGVNAIEFETMALVSTVVIALQMLILLGGGINGATGGRLSFGHTSLQNNFGNRRNNPVSSVAHKGKSQ